MKPLQTYLFAGITILVLMFYLWLVSLKKRDASIIDPFWGLGFVLVTYLFFVFAANGVIERKIVGFALVTIWGIRLSLYLYLRNWGKGEDKRYAAWRKESGGSWWWQSFFKVFLLQGVLMWLLSFPLLVSQSASLPPSLVFFDYLGLALWSNRLFL